MSKSSAAKKARRKRRIAGRNDGWLSDVDHGRVKGVERIATQIIPRGWEFDHDYSTEEFLTWYYPPSAIEVSEDDDVTEPVTRIWVTDPEEAHVILVGAGQTDTALPVEQLFAKLSDIEDYRAGAEAPVLSSH